MEPIIKILTALAFTAFASGVAAAPITGADIVTVNGNEWAQADLFISLSWNDINAICPSGACIAGGTLNGYDMTGWSWASVDDANALFNTYLQAAGVSGSDLLGPGKDTFVDYDGAAWADNFIQDWRPTILAQGPSPYYELAGFTSTLLVNPFTGVTGGATASLHAYSNNLVDWVVTDWGPSPERSNTSLGGLFFRSPVPAPPTLVVLSLGLAGIGWIQFRKTST